ncbi:MAG: hypothetical protein H7256_08835 [Bdellovibrio sp.]|nr:hypothetical protein [Bdellovibrio sp.]
MKKLLVAACALFIVGCEDIGGTLNVLKSFSATTEDGTQTIAVGSYDTSLNFKKKEVIATLKSAGKSTKISINIPKGTSIPDNGTFEIKSSQSGQPFGVTGVNKTDETRSENRVEYISCQTTRYENVCTPQGCFTRPVNVIGQQQTEYYMSTVKRDMQLDLNADVDAVAHFAGVSNTTQKVIVRQSPCW